MSTLTAAPCDPALAMRTAEHSRLGNGAGARAGVAGRFAVGLAWLGYALVWLVTLAALLGPPAALLAAAAGLLDL